MGARAGFDADFFLVIQRRTAACSTTAAPEPAPARAQGCYFDATAADPAELDAFLRLWDEHQSAPPAQTAGGARPPPTTTSPDWPPRRGPAAARRRVRVPAHLGLGAVDLLRRRDRHALPPRAARQGRQQMIPATTGGAAARRCSGTTLCPTPASPPPRPSSFISRKTRSPTGRPSLPSTTTRTSTMNRVRRLIQLRRSTPELRPGATTTVLARLPVRLPPRRSPPRRRQPLRDLS